MNLQDIKKRAGQIANYSGQGAKGNREYGMTKKGYYSYNGSMDEFVHFDGAQNGQAFSDEINTHRTFEVTFDTTADGNDIEVILFPSIYPSTGLLIAGDGAVGGGGTGFDTVSFTGSPQPLRFMQEWLKNFPTRVVGMKLTCGNELQHSNTASLYPKNPWREAVEPRTLRFSHHSNEYKEQLTITTIKEQFQLDPKTEMRIRLKGETTGTLTFFFGAVLDSSEALKVKAAVAGAASV